MNIMKTPAGKKKTCIILTSQSKMLEFSNNIVAIESTHSLNAYEYARVFMTDITHVLYKAWR